MGVIKSGGFNTGRMYTDYGQQIYWEQDENNIVTFWDRSRMIAGVIRHPVVCPTPASIMRNYDDCNYDMGPMLSVPDGFDFGSKLRI